MKKILRLLQTIKFLKFKQIYYRIYYIIRKRIRNILSIKSNLIKKSNPNPIIIYPSIHIIDIYKSNSFTILSLIKDFKEDIDWNFLEYGKLWTYNLCYFDYLSQSNSKEFGEKLIYDFINKLNHRDISLDSFPISLRGLNWIKFLSLNNIKDKRINDSLYAQYYILFDNLEYHLLGNHLLENGFSLLFGGYYFKDDILYNKAKEILIRELNEQILDDGGHFEQSPMYHQIMLFRLLDCINLVKNNSYKNRELLSLFIQKAELMLGWLNKISYKNGDIPLLNDSANYIAPTTKQLFTYAKRLNIIIKENIELNQSGYRKIAKNNYEIIVDIGDIKASYIAGHTHADTFNFELRIDNKPFIVDSGISTYNISKKRDIDRSTKAHNTVVINGKNSSDVWGGFRVANRADIIETIVRDNYIKATHNGYSPIFHSRKWIFNNNKIVIEDRLNKESNAISILHFHPDISKEDILKYISIESEDKIDLEFKKYEYSSEFNKNRSAIAIFIKFRYCLKTIINI